jgi:hypothetical protein
MHPMELLGDVRMWNLILVRLETMSVSCKNGAGLRQMYHRLRESFWTHPMELLGDEAQVEARFSLFGDSANLDAR